MSVIANTFNTMYVGLDGLEKRTDRLYNSINQKYQYFTNTYTTVMDTYKDLKQEIKDTYDTVNNICKKAEKAYQKVKPAVDWGKKVFGSAFSKIKNFFYNSPASKPGSIDDVVDSPSKTKTPPVVKDVSLEIARMTEQPLIYEAVGTVRAGITSNLDSKLLGTIEDIRVREGDRVKKGDTLLIIDQRQVKAGVRQAEAGLSEAKEALAAAISARHAAKAEEELTLTTYKRYLTLKEEKLEKSRGDGGCSDCPGQTG